MSCVQHLEQYDQENIEVNFVQKISCSPVRKNRRKGLVQAFDFQCLIIKFSSLLKYLSSFEKFKAFHFNYGGSF